MNGCGARYFFNGEQEINTFTLRDRLSGAFGRAEFEGDRHFAADVPAADGIFRSQLRDPDGSRGRCVGRECYRKAFDPGPRTARA